MQTALLTHAHSDPGTQKNGPLPMPSTVPMSPAVPARARSRQPRRSDLDSLLRSHPAREQGTAQDANLEPTPGIFLGLRVALFFNAGLGIAALLAYETWSMLAR